MKKKIFALTILFTTLIQPIVLADDGEAAGWKFVEIARKGLFWIGIFSSFYGLYLILFKKDDTGKKIVITSILVYIASFILPGVFVTIRSTFGK